MVESPEVKGSLWEVKIPAAPRWHQTLVFAPLFPAAAKPEQSAFKEGIFGGDFVGFIPVPVQRDESRHLAAGLIFYIDSFQNPAMEQALSGRQDSSSLLHPFATS